MGSPTTSLPGHRGVWANPVNNARFGEGLRVLCPHRSQEQTGSGQGMIGQFAQTESQSNKLGRLSGLIVPLPGQANSHQRSRSEGRGLAGNMEALEGKTP